MGLPVTLVELAFPSEEWLVKKKKRNAIKVIFPQGCQLTYQAQGDKLLRVNKQGKVVDLYDHISVIKSIPSRKRSDWVFVFRYPQDLHAFIQIVENVTNPDSSIISKEPNYDMLKRSDSLENRNIEYIERMGLRKGDQDTKLTEIERLYNQNTGEKKEEDLTEEERRERDVKLIKDKVFEKKR